MLTHISISLRIDDVFLTGLLGRVIRMKFFEFNSLFVLKSNMVEKSFSNESMSERLVFGHFNHLKNYLLTTQVLWDKMHQFYNKEVETSNQTLRF